MRGSKDSLGLIGLSVHEVFSHIQKVLLHGSTSLYDPFDLFFCYSIAFISHMVSFVFEVWKRLRLLWIEGASIIFNMF